jgi:L-seryl-tRNA(Ser) seleniumtransferase
VIVSRGELVEIGGTFRIPEVLRKGGARLREVGTTNKTRLGDYKDAVSSDTGLILKVHRSNFDIVGFTEFTSRRNWSRRPDLRAARGGPERLSRRSRTAREGAHGTGLLEGGDVAAFSGDKLRVLQAGLAAGRLDDASASLLPCAASRQDDDRGLDAVLADHESAGRRARPRPA